MIPGLTMKSFVGIVAVTPVKHRQFAQQALEQIPRQGTGWFAERSYVSFVFPSGPLESRDPAVPQLILGPW